MLNRLINKLLDTDSRKHTVSYDRVNNLNINVMVRNHTNRIRLPTGKVEQAKIMYLFQPPRKGYDN